MKIKKRLIRELKEAEYNPRKISKEDFGEIKNSLLKFGFVDPIVVNVNKERNGVVVGGHQRCKVWAQMGNLSVPVYEVNLELDQERELNIRLNKNKGEFDKQILEELFSADELESYGFPTKDYADDLEPVVDEDLLDEMKEEFYNHTIQQIVLKYDKIKYENILLRLDDLCTELDCEDYSELILLIIEKNENKK